MSQNYTEFQKLSYKDIEALLITVSECTAKKYFSDIKKQFNIDVVLFWHFKSYFKITEIA